MHVTQDESLVPSAHFAYQVYVKQKVTAARSQTSCGGAIGTNVLDRAGSLKGCSKISVLTTAGYQDTGGPWVGTTGSLAAGNPVRSGSKKRINQVQMAMPQRQERPCVDNMNMKARSMEASAPWRHVQQDY